MSQKNRHKNELISGICCLAILLLLAIAVLPAFTASTLTAGQTVNDLTTGPDKPGITTDSFYPQNIAANDNRTTNSDIDTQTQANLSVKKRYDKGNIKQMISLTGREKSQALLSQVWRLINCYYYNGKSDQIILDRAIAELKAAVSDPEIFGLYDITPAQSDNLLNFISHQVSLNYQKESLNFNNIEIMMKNISDYCQHAGLNDTWPVMEIVMALCDNLDKYSRYIMPDEHSAMLNSIKGDYMGIGTDLVFRDNTYPLIFDVINDSPAYKAGLKPGDLLINICKTDLKNISDSNFDKLLADNKKNVELNIKRNEQTLSFSLEKTLVFAPSVRNVHIIPGTNTAYLRIAAFDNNTSTELLNSFSTLPTSVDKLIIDLRDNGGGVVSSAINTTDLFLADGMIVTIRSQTNDKSYYASADNFKLENIPLIILVNEYTASAAEIFTAALKENNRAIVIGNKTFGKAMIQTVYDLDNNAGALVLTTAEYLPPSLKSFNNIGITPAIAVLNTENRDFTSNNECITDRISIKNPLISIALDYTP